MSAVPVNSSNEAPPNDAASGKAWTIFWVALAAACVPMLLVYFGQMWSMERYQYFPFVFVTIGAMLYQRFDRKFLPPKNAYRWGQIGLALLFVVASILLASPWLMAIGFVLVMASFLGSAHDRLGRSLIVLVLPLLMLVRLPLGYDQLLVIKLQEVTTHLSSVMLDLFGVPHSAIANVIRLPSRELFVAEACSGIQSVFTLAFISLVVITFLNRRIWLTPIYLGIAILLAVAANVIRVTVVALGEAWYGVDLATGWQHDLVGYMALCVAVLFLLSFDQLVMTLLHPVEVTDGGAVLNPVSIGWNWIVGNKNDEQHVAAETPPPSADESTLVRRLVHNPIFRGGFAAAISLLLLGSAAQAVRLTFFKEDPNALPARELVFQVPENLFGGAELESLEIGKHDLSRGGSNPRLGDNADLWEVKIGDQMGQMVLSQPYKGWHELCMCYEIQDWILINREVVAARPGGDVRTDTGADTPLALARLKNSEGLHGYLFYTCLGSNGDLIAPPAKPGRLGSRFDDLIYSGDAFDREDLMMLQMWVVTGKKFEPAVLNDLKSDFLTMRAAIVSAASGSDGASDPAMASEASGGTRADAAAATEEAK